MTSKELPPAFYPTAQDKVGLFRRHELKASPVSRYFTGAPHDEAVRVVGDQDALERAVSVCQKHALTVLYWTSEQTYRKHLSGEDQIWTLVFNFWEGTNRPQYGGRLSDLLSN